MQKINFIKERLMSKKLIYKGSIVYFAVHKLNSMLFIYFICDTHTFLRINIYFFQICNLINSSGVIGVMPKRLIEEASGIVAFCVSASKLTCIIRARPG